MNSGAARFHAAARRPTEKGGDGDRARGALLGTFVGDALGMPYEGALPAEVPAVLTMRDARLGRGTYTDDTEMMVLLAESLVRCDVVDEEDLARTFVAGCDLRRGYGAGTRQVLELLRAGLPVAEAARQVFNGRGSLGNGAAMRVAPIAVRFFDDEALLATQARRNARVTHAHPVGVDGAVVQAAAIAAALNDRDPLEAALAATTTHELQRALQTITERTTHGLQPLALALTPGGVSAAADAAVAAAIVASAHAESFEEAVSTAVRAGGDTDTTAAMAGAIAGARFGAGTIPADWHGALEDGERGRSHVERLAGELAARAATPTTTHTRRRARR
jgi:poly(ADP-ribose) glycohydrolase ARH3